jgi:putative ABC transport system permease protein
VLRPDFKFPDNQFRKFNLDLILPVPIDPGNRDDLTAGYLNLVGRLKPGVTPQQAQAEVATIAHNARVKLARSSDNYGLRAAVVPLQKDMVGDTRLTLLILLGAVAFVLLIACANVANLSLARVTARNREIAIRTALGARRGRIIRQLLAESVLLSLVGGAAGVLLAVWGIDLLVALLPTECEEETMNTSWQDLRYPVHTLVPH